MKIVFSLPMLALVIGIVIGEYNGVDYAKEKASLGYGWSVKQYEQVKTSTKKLYKKHFTQSKPKTVAPKKVKVNRKKSSLKKVASKKEIFSKKWLNRRHKSETVRLKKKYPKARIYVTYVHPITTQYTRTSNQKHCVVTERFGAKKSIREKCQYFK